MPIALGAVQHALELLDERLSPLRVGPAEQRLGFLPRQLEAVQGRADRLATAHQPEALASPADQATQRPAWGWIRPDEGRRRGRALGGADRLAEFGFALGAKKGTAAARTTERERVGAALVIGVHPTHHGVSPPACAPGHLRGAAVLGDVE